MSWSAPPEQPRHQPLQLFQAERLGQDVQVPKLRQLIGALPNLQSVTRAHDEWHLPQPAVKAAEQDQFPAGHVRVVVAQHQVHDQQVGFGADDVLEGPNLAMHGRDPIAVPILTQQLDQHAQELRGIVDHGDSRSVLAGHAALSADGRARCRTSECQHQ